MKRLGYRTLATWQRRDEWQHGAVSRPAANRAERRQVVAKQQRKKGT